MNLNSRIRQFHRWMSLAFTLAVIVNLVALGVTGAPVWIGFLALAPLVMLLATGLYLFAFPYIARQRGNRATRQEPS